MSRILVFDTSIATQNLGDIIICDAVYEHVNGIFSKSHFMNTATHDYIGRQTYKLNRRCEQSFVAGSNLLSSNMNSYNQWKINLYDAIFLRDITLVGVGWWQYQNKPNLYTKCLLNTILSKNTIHSVRDQYTVEQLGSIGLKNVINTGCPTTWNLTKEHCSKIDECKSNNVVFTLTDYNKDLSSDKILVELLIREYKNVYFWPQGDGDYLYLKSLLEDEIFNAINILKPNMSSYNTILQQHNIDYIGTRLHAGIRSLQYKNRTLIIAIDNRAIEMGNDIILPVIERGDYSSLKDFVNKKYTTEIKIKSDEIEEWKGQFRK